MSEAQDKRRAGWEAFLGTLTPSAQAEIKIKPNTDLLVTPEVQVPPTEEADDYRHWRNTLTSEAQTIADELVTVVEKISDEVTPDTAQAKYCLVECEDGEWARLRLFRTPEALVRRLGELEGQDVVAWPFYGIPMQFTKGPQRYLLMPDGSTAIAIPHYVGGPIKSVDIELISSIDPQDDAYLGPLALIESHGVSTPPKIEQAKLGKSKRKKKSDDDDEDEEDVTS